MKQGSNRPQYVSLLAWKDPRMFIAHIMEAAVSIDRKHADFSSSFPSGDSIDEIYMQAYMDVHQRFVKSLPKFSQLTQ